MSCRSPSCCYCTVTSGRHDSDSSDLPRLLPVSGLRPLRLWAKCIFHLIVSWGDLVTLVTTLPDTTDKETLFPKAEKPEAHSSNMERRGFSGTKPAGCIGFSHLHLLVHRFMWDAVLRIKASDRCMCAFWFMMTRGWGSTMVERHHQVAHLVAGTGSWEITFPSTCRRERAHKWGNTTKLWKLTPSDMLPPASLPS